MEGGKNSWSATGGLLVRTRQAKPSAEKEDGVWQLKKLVVWITLVLRCGVLIRPGRFLRAHWARHSALSKRPAMVGFGLQSLI